jgi:CRISPR/Cas system-associated exonuclease Cas4 (RecB family)
VKDKVHELFGKSDYQKILVVWNTENDFLVLPRIAKEKYGFEILSLRKIIHELKQKKGSTGSRDDIMRPMELISIEEKEAFRKSLREIEKAVKEKIVRSSKDREHVHKLLNAIRLVKKDQTQLPRTMKERPSPDC